MKKSKTIKIVSKLLLSIALLPFICSCTSSIDTDSVSSDITPEESAAESRAATASVPAATSANGIGSRHPSSGNYSVASYPSTGKAGATIDSSGNVTFSLYSKNATNVLLEFYDAAYGKEASYDYWMAKCSDGYWRIKIKGVPKNTMYAFRLWGPNWKYSSNWNRYGSNEGFVSDVDSKGNRFNPNKVLIDPYAKEITHDKSNPAALSCTGSKVGTYVFTSGSSYRSWDTGIWAPKAYVINDSTGFGTKPRIAQKDAVIYEAHLRGLTKHNSTANLTTILSGIDGFGSVKNVPSAYQGTYKGAGLMAPYLKALGINTIEFLPVQETDNDANPDNSSGGNFWGYMTYGYFAPDRRYAYDKSAGGPTKEFKEMVKAFHDAGIEVYLDIVFNHTGEGGCWQGSGDDYAQAELLSFRGIDNSTYYCLTNSGKSYWETTACGNNLQCDNSTVRQFIIDSLTYWIKTMGVDGFRFDLAPVLGRQGSGSWNFSPGATTLNSIMSLGKSNDVEMIAEAWDASGTKDGYQVGNFPSGWGEWNGHFRDSIRAFVGNGSRTCETWGSYYNITDQIYGWFGGYSDQGGPSKSVNFVTAHDGFTLADLCSYEGQSNSRNSSLSWPFGASDGGSDFYNHTDFGSTPAARRQAARNYIAIQMMSRGVPMITYGDELCRTQNGNDNVYNLDSVATWNNYNMINTSSPHSVATNYGGSYDNRFGTFANQNNTNGNFRFMNYMLKLHRDEIALRQNDYSSVEYSYKKEDGVTSLSSDERCVWLKIKGSAVSGGSDYLVFMNMYTSGVDFTVPSPESGKWTRIADTSEWAEYNYNYWGDSDTVCQYSSSGKYYVNPWSVVIFKRIK